MHPSTNLNLDGKISSRKTSSRTAAPFSCIDIEKRVRKTMTPAFPRWFLLRRTEFERKTTHGSLAEKKLRNIARCLIEISPGTTCLHNLVAISKHGAVTVGWCVGFPFPSPLLAFFLFLFLFFLILIPPFSRLVSFQCIYIYIYTHWPVVKLNRTRNKCMRDTSYSIH